MLQYGSCKLGSRHGKQPCVRVQQRPLYLDRQESAGAAALLVLGMLLMLDWEKEAERAQEMQLLQRQGEEEGDEEEAGGDTFPDSSARPVVRVPPTAAEWIGMSPVASLRHTAAAHVEYCKDELEQYCCLAAASVGREEHGVGICI